MHSVPIDEAGLWEFYTSMNVSYIEAHIKWVNTILINPSPEDQSLSLAPRWCLLGNNYPEPNMSSSNHMLCCSSEKQTEKQTLFLPNMEKWHRLRVFDFNSSSKRWDFLLTSTPEIFLWGFVLGFAILQLHCRYYYSPLKCITTGAQARECCHRQNLKTQYAVYCREIHLVGIRWMSFVWPRLTRAWMSVVIYI